jgi:hypothetical protein
MDEGHWEIDRRQWPSSSPWKSVLGDCSIAMLAVSLSRGRSPSAHVKCGQVYCRHLQHADIMPQLYAIALFPFVFYANAFAREACA